jgi:hypothetical protein
MTNPNRREFIRQTALAAGMLAIGACGHNIKSTDLTLDPEAIRKFRKNFSGSIIIPGDKDYESARAVLEMNPATSKFPAIVAKCKNNDDVLRCIDLAHQHALETAVRSGNHSNVGWGTCEKGIVIDLSGMKSITVNPGNQTAWVTAGNLSEEIHAAAAKYNLAPVLGECGTVGAGVALGGGLGYISGKYGATSDNMLSANMITANGQSVKADANNHEDLYWAIRGGGGNFGIATALEYKLHPVHEMLAGGLVYPIAQARGLLRYFREFMSTAPDELQAECYLSSMGDGFFRVDFVYIDNLIAGEQLLNNFRKFNKPEKDSVRRRTFAEAYTFNIGENVEFCPFTSTKGSYIQHLSDDAIDVVINRFNERPPSCETTFNFSHFMHGEVCRIAPDITAFELRAPNAIHLASWTSWKETAHTDACMSWHRKTFELLLPFSGGRVFANYMSEPANGKSIFGQNFDRLIQIKKKYDPENFFHLNQNIVPA